MACSRVLYSKAYLRVYLSVSWGIGRLVPPKWWDPMISRVIAVAACGLSLAACSSWMSSLPSLPSLPSTPTTSNPSPRPGPIEALRIESEPPGAEAKTSQGQSCRTPCEIAVQTGNEFSVTLALNGYQPQTVSVRPEAPPPPVRDSAPLPGSLMSPNPIYVELQPASAVTPATKKPAARKKKPAVAVARPPAPAPAPTTTASVPAPAPPPMPAAPPEPAASATNYPWPSR
jgi:PEGA domain-containing protein